jgi:hypothetical protein
MGAAKVVNATITRDERINSDDWKKAFKPSWIHFWIVLSLLIINTIDIFTRSKFDSPDIVHNWFLNPVHLILIHLISRAWHSQHPQLYETIYFIPTILYYYVLASISKGVYLVAKNAKKGLRVLAVLVLIALA